MKLKNKIIADLKSLYLNNFIHNAKILNKNLCKNIHFSENLEPMFFTGNLESKTVLIMLNPGKEDSVYSFKINEKNKYKSFKNYMNNYFEKHSNFGTYDEKRTDAFDLKQAAFLLGFGDTKISIQENFWKTKELKKEAKKNVLNQKLQLEFIPYSSKTFTGFFDTKRQILTNIPIFEIYILDLLDIIFNKKRDYVIFCSKQFSNIFKSLNHKDIKIIFSDIKKTKFNTSKISFTAQKAEITFKGKKMNVIIANTFPNRALPNAYVLMKKYGKFCKNTLKS